MTTHHLITLVKPAREAVTHITGDTGTFQIGDGDLMVLSRESRRDLQDALVDVFTEAGCVLEWRRPEPKTPEDSPPTIFTWRRQSE